MRKHDQITVSATAFENGYADLKIGPIPVLETLIEKFSVTKHAFEIAGYTADDLSESYNTDLSQRRADAVRSYLYAKGIAMYRMQTVGHGALAPIATNTTAAGRELNRRVEVTVIPG